MLKLGNKIDFYATHIQYFHHIYPVWQKLPASLKNKFYIYPQLLQRLQEENYQIPEAISSEFLPFSEDNHLIYCASHTNLKEVREYGRKVIYTEHGMGQSFTGISHQSYIGGERAGVVAIFVPGPKQAEKQINAYPTIPVYQVGVPKLDKYHQQDLSNSNDPNTVCISFHWECRVLPETKSAFRHYRGALPELGRSEEFTLLGHGHPNNAAKFSRYYNHNNIEYLKNFSDVIDRASLYVCDSSSTIYEWLSLGRDVVLLNIPQYRRDVEHGMRFWEHADMGVNVDNKRELKDKILEALARRGEFDKRRQEILQEVFATTDGNAAQLAADAIQETVARWAD